MESTVFVAELGKGSAKIKIPAGNLVEVEGRQDGVLLLKRGEAKAQVPIEKTDYEEQIAKLHSEKQNITSGEKNVENKFGQIGSPYIREAPVGNYPEPPKPDYSDPFLPIPVEEWTGFQFLFLPLRQYEASEGYAGSTKKVAWHKIEKSLDYEKYKGRSFTVSKVEKDSSFGTITVQMDDTREVLYLPISTGKFEGIALKRDIDYARANYVGKTLWIRNTEATAYDSDKKEERKLVLKNLQPVKVLDVVLNETPTWPLRFILQDTEGRTFTKISQLSGTTTESFSYNSYLFEDVFFLEDPKKKYSWDEGVFAAIEVGKIFPGMTKEQVRISWGNPRKINKTISGGQVLEQWVYPVDVYIYFDGNKLTAIQN